MTVIKNKKTEEQYTKTAKKAVTNPIVKKPTAKKKTNKTAMEHFLDSYKENEELYKLLAE